MLANTYSASAKVSHCPGLKGVAGWFIHPGSSQ